MKLDIVNKLLEGIQDGNTIDDFLSDVRMSEDIAGLFTDEVVRRELTDDEGGSIRYCSLIHALAYRTYLMHSQVPEVGKSHRAYHDLNVLRDIVYSMHRDEKMLIISAYMAKSVPDRQLREKYEGLYYTFRKKVKHKILDYFRKLESMKTERLVSRFGLRGLIGDLYQGLRGFEKRYHNGDKPSKGLSRYLWLRTNSDWEIHETEKRIRQIGYYLDVDNVPQLRKGPLHA